MDEHFVILTLNDPRTLNHPNFFDPPKAIQSQYYELLIDECCINEFTWESCMKGIIEVR